MEYILIENLDLLLLLTLSVPCSSNTCKKVLNASDFKYTDPSSACTVTKNKMVNKINGNLNNGRKE